MPILDDSAALARNWRTVLAVDLAVGLVVVGLGTWVMAGVSVFLGAPLAAAGLAYVYGVVRRTRRWLGIRRRAGLQAAGEVGPGRSTTRRRRRPRRRGPEGPTGRCSRGTGR